jgi:hypothetical protein
MKKYLKGVLYSSVIICIVGFITSFIFEKISANTRMNLFNKVKNNARFYSYETYTGAVNQTFYFTDTSDFIIIENYYNILKEKGETSSLGSIDLNLVPLYQELIVFDSLPDRKYIQFIYFYDSTLNYHKGYLLKDLIRKTQPSDTLFIK